MVKKTAENSYGGMAGRTSSPELSDKNPRQNFRLGDITWVKHGGSSWWPAQVIDEASVSTKPKKKTDHYALVRLYGTCQYLYVDPWKSNMEFKMILKEENKTAMEAFHEVLQKELTRFKSPSDHDEEPVSTKALGTAKTSVSADQDQEVWSNATTGVAVQEGRKQKGGRQAKGHASAEGRDKTHKQGSVVRVKKGRKMASLGTSVVEKEGVRRSGRTTAKEYLDASDDSTSQLHDTSADEDATEVGGTTPVNRRQHKKGSVVDGTHREIKAMVRDMLFVDVVARQHATEMSYVDDVIFGICDGTVGMVAHGTTADTEGGRSIKRTGSRLEADSNNAAKRPKQSGDEAMEGSEQHSARQIKIMQKLGLVAPSGSPFKGLAAAAHG